MGKAKKIANKSQKEGLAILMKWRKTDSEISEKKLKYQKNLIIDQKIEIENQKGQIFILVNKLEKLKKIGLEDTISKFENALKIQVRKHRNAERRIVNLRNELKAKENLIGIQKQ